MGDYCRDPRYLRILKHQRQQRKMRRECSLITCAAIMSTSLAYDAVIYSTLLPANCSQVPLSESL